MTNVTVQVMKAMSGYGNVGDVITIVETAQSDLLTTYGVLQTYSGPITPTIYPIDVLRSVMSLAAPGALPTPGPGIDVTVFLTAAGAIPTLPTAVGNGSKYTIINQSGASITPATTASQTINGSAPAAMANNTAQTLIADSAGTNWRIN